MAKKKWSPNQPPKAAPNVSDAPGWDTIDAALKPIYGDQEPIHVGTVLSYALGGPDPIHGISAYKVDKPVPHWHFVTYGFTELWAKERADPALSGFGFELTLRLVRDKKETQPPNFAFNFLQNLGRYIFTSGNFFDVSHTVPLNGPICQGDPTLIHAITFALDPQLPPQESPNGAFKFLQIVGLTMDELEAIGSWSPSAFLKLREEHDPLLLTDLRRKSWLTDKAFAKEVARRTKKEGSSSAFLFAKMQRKKQRTTTVVELQTIVMDSLAKRLPQRLLFDRDLTLHGSDFQVVFQSGPKSQATIDADTIVITLSANDAEAWAATLAPHVGTYPLPGIKNVTIKAIRTEIKDSDGKVIEVIE